MSEARFVRGQNPRETMKIGIAKVLFDKTTNKGDGSGAYSYGLYYNDEEWMRIIQWLLKKFTPFDVENILRSKLMRWASDQAGDYRKISDVDEPQNTLEDFTRFNKSDRNFRAEYKSAAHDFLWSEIHSKPDEEEYWRKTLGYDQKGNPINEDMGGVSAPMATLNNTPGMGNAVPPSKGGIGSGDSWGNKLKKKPYAQAKKMTLQSPFKKKKGKKIKLVKENLNESL